MHPVFRVEHLVLFCLAALRRPLRSAFCILTASSKRCSHALPRLTLLTLQSRLPDVFLACWVNCPASACWRQNVQCGCGLAGDVMPCRLTPSPRDRAPRHAAQVRAKTFVAVGHETANNRGKRALGGKGEAMDADLLANMELGVHAPAAGGPPARAWRARRPAARAMARRRTRRRTPRAASSTSAAPHCWTTTASSSPARRCAPTSCQPWLSGEGVRMPAAPVTQLHSAG